MATSIVFETHSTSEDNEAGIASGWRHSRLSVAGRDQARQLGDRRRSDGIAVIFASDLLRASETATVAFDGSRVPVLLDWRLRECHYGELNGMAVADLHRDRARHLDTPYPGGESWRDAVARVAGFLADLPSRWDDSRVLVIGHVATRWALDHLVNQVPLEELINESFLWQRGWEYHLS